jgi:uncharacterized protein YndB with AHSA1/START domain
MIDRASTHHLTFTIERTYEASPSRVFAAIANPQEKARWFAGPRGQYTELERSMDFRVGGRERLKGAWTNGMVSDFQAVYLDIVPDARIVYAYGMHVNEQRISVSLATVELTPVSNGTTLVFTEQAVFLDGYPTPEDREVGSAALLDNLGAYLKEAARKASV